MNDSASTVSIAKGMSPEILANILDNSAQRQSETFLKNITTLAALKVWSQAGKKAPESNEEIKKIVDAMRPKIGKTDRRQRLTASEKQGDRIATLTKWMDTFGKSLTSVTNV